MKTAGGLLSASCVILTLAFFGTLTSIVHAQPYTTIDDPLAAPGTTNVVAVSGNNIVGNYDDNSGTPHGFLYNGSIYTTIDEPLAAPGTTKVVAVSGNNVVGNYGVTAYDYDHGFLYNGSTYTTLRGYDGTGEGIKIAAISGSNIVCYQYGVCYLYNGSTYTKLHDPSGASDYTNGVAVSGGDVAGNYNASNSNAITHGFLYSGNTYTTISDPLGARSYDDTTTVVSISGNNVVGNYQDSNYVTHGFLYNGGNYTTIDDPLESHDYFGGTTTVVAVSGNNVVGNYDVTLSGYAHGFLYNGSAYTTIDYSAAMPNSIAVVAVSGDNVVGNYVSNNISHGFLYKYTASTPLSITTKSLPDAISGQAYRFQLTSTGGQGTVTWTGTAASGSTLPAGFSLSSDGVLSSTGTPAATPGVYTLNIVATDSTGAAARKQFTLTVDGIVDARLNVPKLTLYPDNSRNLVQSVYVEGAGKKVTVSGRWFDLGGSTAQLIRSISNVQVDFSTGKWQKLDDLQDPNSAPNNPGYRIPRSGNHVIEFVMDTPTSLTTSPESVAVTGFIPSINGWQFSNSSKFLEKFNPKHFDGFCSGFVESIRDHYDSISTNPKINYSEAAPDTPTYILLRNYETLSTEWTWNNPGTDYKRIEPALVYPLDAATYTPTLYSEASMITSQIAAGDPCHIGLYTLQNPDPTLAFAHAVLGTVAFNSYNIYDSDGFNEINAMILFSIYDPNEALDNSRYVEVLDTGSSVPQFTFIPQDSVNVSYKMWNAGTFHKKGTNP